MFNFDYWILPVIIAIPFSLLLAFIVLQQQISLLIRFLGYDPFRIKKMNEIYYREAMTKIKIN